MNGGFLIPQDNKMLNDNPSLVPELMHPALAAFLRFVYGKEYIKASEELAQMSLRCKSSERMAIIKTLRDIAMSTSDDQTKYYMFNQIAMFANMR